jgi:hypothetical protein
VSLPYQQKVIDFFNAMNEARTCPESFILELTTAENSLSAGTTKTPYEELITYLTGKTAIAAFA